MNVLISEFESNPPGSDPSTQSIELFGTPGASFSGWLLSIESDNGNSAGTVDRATQVSGTFDASGLLTVEVSDLENPSFTLVLVDTFTGSVGDDFDTNNDGVVDVTLASLGINQVHDAIGIPDDVGDESSLYGAELGGVDFNFTGEEPQRVFRSGSNGDLYAVNILGDTQVFDTNGTAVNASEFTADPAAATNFGALNEAFVVPPSAFTLELLHFTDQEANAATIDNIDNLSAVLNALRDEDLGGDGLADNTLTLSAGDAIIPGLFFDASKAVFGSEGIADIQIQNELGVQAIALGNHEFDLGTELLAGLIDGSAPGDFSALTSGTALDGLDFTGTAFPYLSANLDFSTDANLAPLATAGGQDAASLSNVVTSSAVSDVNGELIGIVGATVPTIRSISSPGDDLGIAPPWASSSPTSAELDALAAILQTEVDQLLTDNPTMNKVVLLSHMQQISIEQELAARLVNVDIIVAGGSNTRLFDGNDRVRDGDSDQGQYPLFIENAGGTTTAVVNTDGNYKYVGRLVVDFDADGNIIPSSYDPTVSGAYATDDQGVADLGAESLVDPEIDAITDAIQAQIVATESNVFGVSNVFLNGNRAGTFEADDPDGVRTQETNLGNLTADANLEYAQSFDSTVVVSIKNGGGIRANIGEIVVPAGGTEAVRLPNSAVLDENGVEVKPVGGISQNDIATTLAFNNGLTLLDMTRQELKDFMEGSISALPGGSSGGFPQLSGLKFSFDESRTAQTYDLDGSILVAGDRVINAGIFDEAGALIAEIVRDGEVVEGPETFRVVTLNFLADSGDEILSSLSTPNRVDLIDLDGDGTDDDLFTGDAIFATDGSEQDALAEYLDDNHADAATAFDQADAGPNGDLRIQNLTFTSDTIFDDGPVLEPTPVATGDVAFEQVAIFQGEGEQPGDGDGAAESVAHEAGKLYVTNGAQDRIDIFTIPDTVGGLTDPAQSIDLSGLDGYDGVQSVAVQNGVVAVAISRAAVETPLFDGTVMLSQPGFVALFDATTLALLSRIDVGNLPDQLTFNADGTQLLVAGEGEKNDDSVNDDNPLGTVAVIDTTDPTAPTAEILDFSVFNGLEDQARGAGIRIQDGVSFATDVEPEYIAISPDGTTAFVSLQENNAIAKIDLSDNSIVDVFSLGTVDFGSDSALDANDNGVINITRFDNLVGFRMADAITSFEVNGQTFVATANEGDSRGFDEDRVGDLDTAGLIDPNVVTAGLERLEVSTIDGDTDGDGDIDVLHSFSSRSFSIFDADGNLVFDSGSQFEQIIADLAPERFNDDDGDDGEDRSDAKGPEPEAIAVGDVGGRLYAFIGLERDSGIMIYDISTPENAFFVNYIPPLHVDNASEGEPALHSPEVIAFISEDDSGTGNAQIAVSYEVSGTTAVFDLTVADPSVTIMEIQGEGHVSAFAGQTVTTTGIVTAVDSSGYYIQDANGDGNDATSDGLFIFTDATPTVAVGDEVRVTGDVSEFIPGGAGTGNLSTTQIARPTSEEILSSGNTVAAKVLGANGRPIPTEIVISDGELPVNLQTDPGQFNPETDGIDFYESLEGMLVTVDNPVAVSATNRFNETWVVADDGANTTPGLNDRGGLNINADADGLGDLNPERIQIQYDGDLLPSGFTGPDLDVGDAIGDVTGVVGYGFGNFEINVTEAFTVDQATSNTAEVTTVAGSESEMTVATYNLLNVTSNMADGDAAQIAQIAQQIVNNLGSPDVLALQEIQDNSGVTDDQILDADETLQAIVDAIAEAGGPVYSFQSALVDEDGENGGVPGGNIRNAFLYNEARVTAKSFETLESDVLSGLGVTNANAFDGSRDPLLGVFTFNEQDITLINNHFSSRFGSDPIFGGPQPFTQGGEAAREAQALAINEVVDALLAGDPEANIAVLGDLNTFEFTDELTEDLPGVGSEKVLTNLIEKSAGDEAYTFIFQGNSQALDHIFVTDGLLDGAEVDFVHVNVDFVDAASDHEPIVASFTLDDTVEGQFLVGTPQNDRREGGAGDDTILGLDGNDRLIGRDGDDFMLGGGGRDRLIGNDGADLMLGEDDNDRLDGNSGDDTLFGGAGNDTLNGSNGDDKLFGNSENDELRGGAGDDTLEGGSGNDFAHGGSGADEVDGGIGNDRLRGGAGNDTLTGGSGQDRLLGGRDDDSLLGGDGEDSLNGDAGENVLTGGGGSDVFQFTKVADNLTDTITDFSRGVDVIDLSAYGITFGDLNLSGGVNALVVYGTDLDVQLTGINSADLSASDFIFV